MLLPIVIHSENSQFREYSDKMSGGVLSQILVVNCIAVSLGVSTSFPPPPWEFRMDMALIILGDPVSMLLLLMLLESYKKQHHVL